MDLIEALLIVCILAQPAGAKGAMNKFKSMEPAGAAPAKPKYVLIWIT